MRRHSALVVAMATLTLLVLQPNAIAASVSDALNGFGLLGAWSPNCAQNPSDPRSRQENAVRPTRWFYTPSSVSNPTLVIYQRHDNGLMRLWFEISSAAQITADKFKYDQVLLGTQLDENPKTDNPNRQVITTVLQRVNDKITLVSQIGDDGTVYVENGQTIVRQPRNGQMVEVTRVPYGVFERCLD
jgi:hypothetical protein